jgi:spore germination protein YaaH
MLLQLLLLHLLLHPAAAATAAITTTASVTSTTHICVSSFTTEAELDQLPWSAVTDLIQSISPLTLHADGTISTLQSWPLSDLAQRAHGNGTRLWVSVKLSSKEDGTTLFSSSPTILTNAANTLVSLIKKTSTSDGFQLDLEGLRPESKSGLETFVRSCGTAATSAGLQMTTTLYAPILLENLKAPVGNF